MQMVVAGVCLPSFFASLRLQERSELQKRSAGRLGGGKKKKEEEGSAGANATHQQTHDDE